MNFDNLFRVCISFCLMLLAFSLVANFVDGLGIFPHTSSIGTEITTSNALSQLTGLDNPSMQGIFLGVTGLAFVGVVALCWATKNVVPLGLYLFGVIFWTSWIRMSSVMSYGGYIPAELLAVFTVGAIFLFVGAIIGMLTGS